MFRGDAAECEELFGGDDTDTDGIFIAGLKGAEFGSRDVSLFGEGIFR
jgi:hypothetical protein